MYWYLIKEFFCGKPITTTEMKLPVEVPPKKDVPPHATIAKQKAKEEYERLLPAKIQHQLEYIDKEINKKIAEGKTNLLIKFSPLKQVEDILRGKGYFANGYDGYYAGDDDSEYIIKWDRDYTNYKEY